MEPLALPIRARFVPLSGRRTAAHPGSAGSSPSCSRRAAGWPCSYPRPGRAAGSARAISSRLPRRGDRVCVAATGMEDQHGAVASGAVPGSGRRGEPRRHAAGVPGVPGQGLDPAEPVMYLSWTGDGPVIYLPYTCAGDAPDHKAAMSACGRCERGARAADLDLAKESRAFHRRRSTAGPGQDRDAVHRASRLSCRSSRWAEELQVPIRA